MNDTIPEQIPPKPQHSNIPGILIFLLLLLLAVSSYFGYQNMQLQSQVAKMQLALNETTSGLSTSNPTDPMANWKTYVSKNFGFSVKYDPSSNPTETSGGDEDVGQFTFIQKIFFGKIPAQSPGGFEIEINNGKSLENYRTEIIGHTADAIDSETKSSYNALTWTKLYYKVLTERETFSFVKAILSTNKYGFAITSDARDIDQILSTFQYVNQNSLGVYCGGMDNISCGSGYACKLNTIGKVELGGVCVNEAETNP